MDPGFLTKCDNVSLSSQAAPGESIICECDEKSFNYILALERKRTERSKRPFILLLLSMEQIPIESRQDLQKKILPCITSSIREIDVLGWYKTGVVLGVIFTEIGNSMEAANRILSRIDSSLEACLQLEELKLVEKSLHFFPDKHGNSDSQIDQTLYPDVKVAHSSRKCALFFKRVIDIVGSLAALILFSPIMAGISVLIKLDSKGPVLFRQKRIGLSGAPFTFLKFRSMQVNNDPTIHKEYVKKLIESSEPASSNTGSNNGQVFKIQNDPRVTPIGRFIRRTSLDELPQFINVLRGEMSLVGPRPPIPYELENYELWHRNRVYDMKPGITGIWQVTGRSRTTFDEMVRLDLYYMKHWSLWLDIKLLLQTPFAVFTSKGAY